MNFVQNIKFGRGIIINARKCGLMHRSFNDGARGYSSGDKPAAVDPEVITPPENICHAADGNTMATPPPSEVDTKLGELENKMKELTLKNKELNDKYMRSLAEAENIRGRYRKEIEHTKSFAIQKFCKSLLQVADTFDLALGSFTGDGKAAPSVESIYKGMELTNLELHKVFSEFKLVKYTADNDPFDPNLHDAVMRVPGPEKDNDTVKTTFKCGYKLNDTVLRPATVSVVMNN